MKIFFNGVVFAGLIWVTACGGAATATPVDSKLDDTPHLSTPAPVTVTDEPATPPQEDTPPPAAQRMVDLSRENLSQMLNISIDQIVTAKVEPATWPDASLGCPQPDMAYAQILTPGFLINLEVDGKQYPYHTDEGESIILCTKN